MGEDFKIKLMEDLWAIKDVQDISPEEKSTLATQSTEFLQNNQPVKAIYILKKLQDYEQLFHLYLKEESWDDALNCALKMQLNDADLLKHKLKICAMLINKNMCSVACLMMKQDNRYPTELINLLLEKSEYFLAYFCADINKDEEYKQKIVEISLKRSKEIVESFEATRNRYTEAINKLKDARQARYDALIAVQQVQAQVNTETVEQEPIYAFKNARVIDYDDFIEEQLPGNVIKKIYKYKPAKPTPELLKSDHSELDGDMKQLSLTDDKQVTVVDQEECFKVAFDVITTTYGLQEVVKKLSMVLSASGGYVKFVRNMNKMFLSLGKFVRSEHFQVWPKNPIEDEIYETVYLESLENISKNYWSPPDCIVEYISVFSDEYKK